MTVQVPNPSRTQRLFAEIFGLGDGLLRVLDMSFDQIDWAEEEIRRSQFHHRGLRDTLHHSFELLQPTHERMTQELVYRSHCRELLGRIAAGQATQPATAAEVVAVLSSASLAAPLNATAVGLYSQVLKQAGCPAPTSLNETATRDAPLATSEIDALEAWTRTKLAVDDRVLGEIDCQGRHLGHAVSCQYADSTPIRRNRPRWARPTLPKSA